MDKELASRRTKFFLVLCTLSTVNAIYGMVSGLINALSPADVDEAFLTGLFEQLETLDLPLEGVRDDVEQYYLNLMLNIGNLGAANFLFFGISLVGVRLMYNLNRVGFTLYVLAQLGLAFSPTVFGGFNAVGQISLATLLFWNGIWILMYASQLKYFKRK